MFENIVLEPTSPIREPDDLNKAMKLFFNKKNKYKSLVSIGEVTEHPAIILRLKENL